MEIQKVSMLERFKGCITKKYLCLSGRARRSEYWGFALILAIILAVLQIAAQACGDGFLSTLLTIAGGLFGLYLLLPGWGVTVRRLHDTGRSGWNMLWALVPVIGTIIFVIFMCKDSQHGTNEYGLSEKYPEA